MEVPDIKGRLTCLLIFLMMGNSGLSAQILTINNKKSIYNSKDNISLLVSNPSPHTIFYYVSLLIEDRAIDQTKIEWRELIQDVKHNNINDRRVVTKILSSKKTDMLKIKCRQVTGIDHSSTKRCRFLLHYFTKSKPEKEIIESYSDIFIINN